MSYIMKNAIKGTYPSFTIDYSQVMVSRGSLAKPLNIQKLNNDNEIAVSWQDNSGTANALDTDFAMVLAYNANKQEAVYDISSACRGDEGASLRYPSDWAGDTAFRYAGYHNPAVDGV